MLGVSVLKVGENRGAPRVWVSCENARRAGFEPGERFVVERSGKGLLIKLDSAGERVVSQKKRGERTVPVIDINSKETLSPLAGCEVVRVVFGRGQIYVSALASELRRQERLERVKRHVAQGGLSTGGIALGGGILSHAVHQGSQGFTGLTPHMLVANEIREELVDHALVAQRRAQPIHRRAQCPSAGGRFR
jgi:DNA (cytosine-5)-methyltransferase 1